MKREYKDLDELYRCALNEVYTDFEFKNSPRGHNEREIIGYNAKILHPAARFCRNPKRKQNIIFNYAEALWYLSGLNNLDFIEYYAPTMAAYSADKRTLPGTGYGAKLLSFGPQCLDQVKRAIHILSQDDPDSKRVVLQIFDAAEDITKKNIDVSCTLAIQLLLRDGRLHAVAFMRANDAYVGLLSDIFSFTFVQEYIASRLGCKLGTYSHHVGSLHIYDVNVESVLGVLHSSLPSISRHDAPMMPVGCTPTLIEDILRYEASIRDGSVRLKDVNSIANMDHYWIDILRLFCIYRCIKSNSSIAKEEIRSLSPLHRDYILARWAEHSSIRAIQEVGK